MTFHGHESHPDLSGTLPQDNPADNNKSLESLPFTTTTIAYNHVSTRKRSCRAQGAFRAFWFAQRRCVRGDARTTILLERKWQLEDFVELLCWNTHIGRHILMTSGSQFRVSFAFIQDVSVCVNLVSLSEDSELTLQRVPWSMLLKRYVISFAECFRRVYNNLSIGEFFFWDV